MAEKKKKQGFGKLEAAILIPNLVLIGVVLIYLAVTRVDGEKVELLVDADPVTQKRIAQLEKDLLRQPGDVTKALELARLYSDVGEFPWSYNALQAAEKHGSDDPSWQLKLALAYLELGKNDDGLRVLDEAVARCGSVKCAPPLRVKLDLFIRVAKLLKERGIDVRKDRTAADKALREVLKPVAVDPAKMRPKAPAELPGEDEDAAQTPAAEGSAAEPAKATTEPDQPKAPSKG